MLVLAPAILWGADNAAAGLAEQIRHAGLDPDECYRVRDLSLFKEDLRLYFTEGYLLFGKPVQGRRLTALFSGEMPGGDGELLVMPPTRSERLSLATFAGAPNLSEHFTFVVLVFSDDTADVLAEKVRSQPRLRPSPEMGSVLAGRWDSVANNLAHSFGVRLVYDLLSDRPPSEGFFYAAVQGRTHGNFDAVYDPLSPEQVQVGQIRFRDNRAFFDVWTSFPSRSARADTARRHEVPFLLRDLRIDATLQPDLELSASTKATLSVSAAPRHVLFFDIARRMEVTDVLLNGEPCAIWKPDSLRANLFGGGAGLFLVLPPAPVEPGEHQIEFRHTGRVVTESGNNVYHVAARSSWYPYIGRGFAHFDITFRYPRDLDLVFPGEVVENAEEGEWRVTRRRTENPIRFAGFNVGRYQQHRTSRDGYQVEIYANQDLETALQPRPQIMIVPRQTPDWPRRRPSGAPEFVAIPAPTPSIDPTARIEPLANEIADVFAFLTEVFGPPPTTTLMVSPIPGNFGQGFPGLLYLSTAAYLDPKDRPEQIRDQYHELFYSEILHAHETAHQWWGNTVTTNTYEDGWLMEALANYSALLLLERRRGEAALRQVMARYRDNLVAKDESGLRVDSAGPICWGPRLDSSRARAWTTITYEKGSWIMHMLRRRMGDESFLKMLGDLCRQYRFQEVTTDEFRRHAAGYLPEGQPDPALEHFFDQWVYDIGIPTLDVSHRTRGNPPAVRVTGRIAQSDVPDYFSALIPIDFELPGGEVIRRWQRTSEDPAEFDYTFKQRPARITINPGDSVLAVLR